VEDPGLLYYLNPALIAPDPNWLNSFMVLHDPNGNVSDVVGVFDTNTDPNGGPVYALGFYSGTGGPFEGAFGSCPQDAAGAPLPGYPTQCDFLESQFDGNVTSMLAFGLQDEEGFTANFTSNETPEPAMLPLVGIGLAVLGWRKLRRA
jgi:hypothetical protein